MKNYMRSLARLVAVPVLTLTLTGGARAQSTPLSGAFGFVAGVSQIDSAGANGGSLLGVMNFDGAGNVTGTAIVKPRNTQNDQAQAIPTTFTGTYSSNPDGTGSVTLSFDVGFAGTFAMVTTDGGQGLQLLQTDCNPCGADVPLRPQSSSSITGGLPISLFFQGATGNIPVTLTGVNAAGGGTLYTAAAATGSGPAQCPDGSAGTWTATVPVLTLMAAGGSGNFLAAVSGSVCGQPDFETHSGLATPTFGAGGAITWVLHGTGAAVSILARAAKGGSLNGSYGVQLNYAPFPAGTVGVMNFDGAGNVTASLTTVGGTVNGSATGTSSGTYSTNPDGSGTINFKTPAGQPGATLAFVIVDGGSQLLLLRTDANPFFDVAWGTARLQ